MIIEDEVLTSALAFLDKDLNNVTDITDYVSECQSITNALKSNLNVSSSDLTELEETLTVGLEAAKSSNAIGIVVKAVIALLATIIVFAVTKLLKLSESSSGGSGGVSKPDDSKSDLSETQSIKIPAIREDLLDLDSTKNEAVLTLPKSKMDPNFVLFLYATEALTSIQGKAEYRVPIKAINNVIKSLVDYSTGEEILQDLKDAIVPSSKGYTISYNRLKLDFIADVFEIYNGNLLFKELLELIDVDKNDRSGVGAVVAKLRATKNLTKEHMDTALNKVLQLKMPTKLSLGGNTPKFVMPSELKGLGRSKRLLTAVSKKRAVNKSLEELKAERLLPTDMTEDNFSRLASAFLDPTIRLPAKALAVLVVKVLPNLVKTQNKHAMAMQSLIRLFLRVFRRKNIRALWKVCDNNLDSVAKDTIITSFNKAAKSNDLDDLSEALMVALEAVERVGKLKDVPRELEDIYLEGKRLGTNNIYTGFFTE